MEATLQRLDGLSKLSAPQARTLIGKLLFLLTFEEEGMEITKTAKRLKIERKTVYNWMETDSVFQKLMHLEEKK